MSARTKRPGEAKPGDKEKPWASGRILTPEQRARKQEVDRKANRVLKKEVQERLARLESRVLQLEQACPGITAGLFKEQEDSGQSSLGDINEHEAVHPPPRPPMGDWAAAAHTDSYHGVPPLWNDPTNHWQGPPPPVPDRSAQGSMSATSQYDPLAPTNIQESWSAPDINAAAPPPPEQAQYAYARGYGPGVHDAVVNINPAPHEFGAAEHPDIFTTARMKPSGREVTYTLSRLVTYVRNMDASQVCFDDYYNQDLLVTAIVRNWEYSLSRYQQRCPLWNILHLVDQSLFKNCQLVERLSVLRILHKMYLYEIASRLNGMAGPLPAWYKPQASQQLITHEPVIDHIAWPKLREHLVLSENNALTNKFWAHVVRDFRFAWNDQPLGSIHFNPETSVYSLAPSFEKAIQDVGNWRMDMPFLQTFPELANDIHPANYMPLNSMMPSFGLGDRAMGRRIQSAPKGYEQQQQQHQAMEMLMPAEDGENDNAPIQGGPWHPGPRRNTNGPL